jgi:hypothetical protein
MISPSLTKRAVNPREIAKAFGAILRSARESGGTRKSEFAYAELRAPCSVWPSTVSKWIKLISNQDDPGCR